MVLPISAAELFRLAEIAWEAEARFVPQDELEDGAGDTWADLSPIEQGREAEGVRAVLDEYVSGGSQAPLREQFRSAAKLVYGGPDESADALASLVLAAMRRAAGTPDPDEGRTSYWPRWQDVPDGVAFRPTGGSDLTYVRRAGDLWAYYGDDPDTAWYSAYNPDSVNYTEHDDLGSVVRV